ncbi:unnamed protein product, partial [Staurois parvus]
FLGHSRSPIHGKSQRCRLGHVISCGSDDQCALMICVAPAAPLVNVYQCQLSSMPPASAHQCHSNATYQCLPVHINAIYQCPSELPFSVTHQCQSVPPINASQCHLSMLPISAIYQCQSV